MPRIGFLVGRIRVDDFYLSKEGERPLVVNGFLLWMSGDCENYAFCLSIDMCLWSSFKWVLSTSNPGIDLTLRLASAASKADSPLMLIYLSQSPISSHIQVWWSLCSFIYLCNSTLYSYLIFPLLSCSSFSLSPRTEIVWSKYFQKYLSFS